MLREIGSALSYLHDFGAAHGCVSPETVWTTPMGRLWLMGWQWAIPPAEMAPGLVPDLRFMPVPSEWVDGTWTPTPLTDQWQLAAICFASLTGETPPSAEAPPIQLLRPEVPRAMAAVIDRALQRGSGASLSIDCVDAARRRSRHRKPNDGDALRRRAGNDAHQRNAGSASALGAR